MKKILLAVDGSEKSKRAAEKAKELAESLNAEITIITVITDTEYFGSHPGVSSEATFYQLEEVTEQRKKQAKEKGRNILEEAESIINEDGLKEIEKIMRRGDSAENICEVAEEGNFDLIILADKGEGGVKRFLLGSTSDKVVRHASNSVLIVK